MDVEKQLKYMILRSLQEVDGEILDITKGLRKTAILPGPRVLKKSMESEDSTYYDMLEQQVLESQDDTMKLKTLYTRRNALIVALKDPKNFLQVINTTIQSLLEFADYMEENK